MDVESRVRKIEPVKPMTKKEQPQEEDVETVAEAHEPESPWYEQIFRKTKEWFETEPDREF
jgi:hypothetical protein